MSHNSNNKLEAASSSYNCIKRSMLRMAPFGDSKFRYLKTPQNRQEVNVLYEMLIIIRNIINCILSLFVLVYFPFAEKETKTSNKIISVSCFFSSQVFFKNFDVRGVLNFFSKRYTMPPRGGRENRSWEQVVGSRPLVEHGNKQVGRQVGREVGCVGW